MSTHIIHKLVALLLCLASTGCTVATGNRDIASKAARDRIHPGMTKAEVSGIMGKPALTIDREGKSDRWAYGYAEMKWKPWPFAKRDEPEFLLSGLEVSFSRKGTVTGVDACRVCSEPECR